MTPSSTQADLVVIGGGFAGLVCALRGIELGLRVILLEKGEGERYPCNSRMSGGIFHVAMRNVRRSPDELYEAIAKASSGEFNEAQARAVSQNAGRLIDWLQARGAKFMKFNLQEAYSWCMAPPRALVPGPDWIDRGPDRLLRQLMAQFLSAGGRIELGTRAIRLIMKGDACAGVVTERNGSEATYQSSAVLIADGGFQANRDLFTENIGKRFDAVFQRGAATGMGDGLQMAKQAGARLTNLQPFYGHLLAQGVQENEKLWPYPELDAFATAGIIVGRDGRRLVNESAGGIAVANQLARLADPACAVAIFDAAIWEGPGKSARIPANPLLVEAGANIVQASSVDEMARHLGLPAETLRRTIEDHNAAVASGTLEQLDPPRFGKVEALPINTSSLMAIGIVPGITYTMGGIEIDGTARVMSTSGRAIQGLFAAGGATGGLEGGGANAYIGGISKAAIFGLLAAEQVARDLGKNDIETTVVKAHTPYPILAMIVRHGEVAARVLALAVVILVGWAGWTLLGWPALPAGLIAGGLLYIVVRSYVEIVTLITEMLSPH